MQTLYLYNKYNKELLLTVEGTMCSADRIIDSQDGGTIGFGDEVEVSSLPDLSEELRKQYREDNPTPEDRLELVEEIMAQILFGGDSL